MSELIQVRKKAQLTLPLSVRKKLGIEEGDYMDVRVRDGEIILRVKKLVDKEQAWFWSERWQKGEMEAEEDIRAGRTRQFPDAGSAVAYLHNRFNEKQEETGKNNR
jgi:AbrB family looped-hinge helix DNA binding protein